MDGWVNGWMDDGWWWMDDGGWLDGWMDGWMDGWLRSIAIARSLARSRSLALALARSSLARSLAARSPLARSFFLMPSRVPLCDRIVAVAFHFLDRKVAACIISMHFRLAPPIDETLWNLIRVLRISCCKPSCVQIVLRLTDIALPPCGFSLKPCWGSGSWLKSQMNMKVLAKQEGCLYWPIMTENNRAILSTQQFSHTYLNKM